MRFVALATDYDGTLATDGRVGPEVVAALERVRFSGRKLILVTGRELGDLERVFPRLDLFERVVAENGALLYRPATREETLLHEPPPAAFVQALRDRGVSPLSVGRVIVATAEPHQTTVLQAILDLGLELQVIFNKGAVMVLPSGINKQTGLDAALKELDLSPHNVVGVGDAENDLAFLGGCECAVAVANALPSVKEKADVVTHRDHGGGVVELADDLVATDLRTLAGDLTRHDLPIGRREDGAEALLPAYGSNVLLVGPSGSGKSTLATALVERLAERAYQFCLVDPEGDYAGIPGAVVVGDSERGPSLGEELEHLARPSEDVVVNLMGLRGEERASFFAALLPRVVEIRAHTGHPHWLIVDEAHHLLPRSWEEAALILPRELTNTLFITLRPGYVHPVVVAACDILIAMGPNPAATFRAVGAETGRPTPEQIPATLSPGQALVWFRGRHEPAFRVRAASPRGEHRRHVRKYAAGDLGPEGSFHFRGPEGRLNLGAQNRALSGMETENAASPAAESSRTDHAGGPTRRE